MDYKKIKILLCPPGSKPKIIEVENSDKALSEILEGPIGVKKMDEDIIALFNDIGEKKDLQINRLILGDPIFGNCIFCRREDGQFTSLSDEEIKELEYLLS